MDIIIILLAIAWAFVCGVIVGRSSTADLTIELPDMRRLFRNALHHAYTRLRIFQDIVGELLVVFIAAAVILCFIIIDVVFIVTIINRHGAP